MDQGECKAVLDTVRVYGKALSPSVFLWGHPWDRGECKAVLDTVSLWQGPVPTCVCVGTLPGIGVSVKLFYGKPISPPVFVFGHSLESG